MIDEVIEKIREEQKRNNRRKNPDLRQDLAIVLGGLATVKQRAQELGVTFKIKKQVYEALAAETYGSKALDEYLSKLAPQKII